MGRFYLCSEEAKYLGKMQMFPWEDIASSMPTGLKDEAAGWAGHSALWVKPACPGILRGEISSNFRAAAQASDSWQPLEPRVLARPPHAFGALGSAAVGPATPVVAQAAAPTPRAAAAPELGCTQQEELGVGHGGGHLGGLGRAFGRRT